MSSGEAGTSAQQPAAVQQPAAPQQAGEGGEVLAEVLVNNRSLSSRAPEEDPDLALAKMLQAQEQAWLAMAGSGALENMPGGGGGGGGGPTAAGPAGEGGAEGEELTDEEMARRLQEEEEREFQQRLLALAGIGAPGGAGSAADAGAGVEAATEYASEDEVDPDDLSYEELTALGEAVGTVSRGLAPADVAALPVQQYYEVAGTTAGEEEQCPICRMEFEPEDEVRVLPLCRHYYHPDCVGEWLKRNKVCCICSKEVLEEGKAAAGGGGNSQAAPAAGVLGERRQ